MTTEDRRKLRAALMHSEGLRLKPYRDTVGVLTIGYGRNLDHVGISEDEAALMLENDITAALEGLDLFLPWWRRLDGVRQRVLADMAFNLGVTKLLKFRNTLAAVQRGDYRAAARGMRNSLWARQVKGRAVRLATMMETGRDVEA